VNAGLLNVLHHSADDNVFAVGDRVDVVFKRVFKKPVDEDRVVRRNINGFLHVHADRITVVADLHGAAAEHVGWPDEHGKSDLFSH